MNTRVLIFRNLAYYWRSHLAAIAGVATAVAVLAGALLVGDSVRGTLRDLAAQRLGQTDFVVVSSGFFREALAADVQSDAAFSRGFDEAAPLIILPAIATHQETGRRLGDVRVYGVDDRFWTFHATGRSGPAEDEALMSAALAEELGAGSGATLLVRVQRPSDIPLESLHGRKENAGRTMRFTAVGAVPAEALGEFSLEQRQSAVRALFVPLSQVQEELEVPDRVNTLLVSAVDGDAGRVDAGGADALEDVIRRTAALADLGLRVTALPARNLLTVTSDAGVMTDQQAAAAAGLSLGAGPSRPLLTYLANTMRAGDREIPYSLVTATDLASVTPDLAAVAAPAIVLNDWAASELQARVGDAVALEYYVWQDTGRLATQSADFHVAAIVPIAAGDRDMAPAYPGITDSPTIVDWDPPFPLDLRRIQRRDEEYWNEYRTTPKAFIDFETGRRLWRSRHGGVTSIRLAPPPGQTLADAQQGYEARLRTDIDPLAAGLAVRDVRAEGVAAARGATDFGAYFVYFSFFLVVSALLLAVLVCKLGVDQRAREIGLLRAVGFGPAALRRVFLAEGFLLSLIGSILGMAGAVAYAALLVTALRTWWVDAVGTRALTLHISAMSLLAGAAGVVIAALVCIWWALRGLGRLSERELLAGQLAADGDRAAASSGRRHAGAGVALAAAGVVLVGAGSVDLIAAAGAFFGAGALLLAAGLCFSSAILRRRAGAGADGRDWGRGWPSVSRLGLRNTTYRPARSVLSIAVIASATFILIAVDAFRRDAGAGAGARSSGTGGYALFVETLVPVAHDPNTEEGRRALNLTGFEGATFEPFRLLPGDDASCLNLYVPTRPRILGASDAFIEQGRFAFQDSLAPNDQERANPWLLLRLPDPTGAIPVIVDANSLTYVLHKRLGDELTIMFGDREITVRFVAALRDSLFQSELVMSQANFVRHFPDQQGYQVFLVDSPDAPGEVAVRVEDALTDIGADATGAAERLAAFHRVENAYLSTFQTLGGLGLLLGTFGLGAVMLRNVIERRRELAMLGALGFRRGHFMLMAAAETILLLAGGLGVGAICAAVAIAPTVVERGGRLPISAVGLLVVFAVFLTGLLSSLAATRVVSRAPVLQSLRTE